jgi:hypothetical protein
MGKINRRTFAGATLATLGATLLPGRASADAASPPKLPTVRWGNHQITRLLVGHNPIKGQSHSTAELSRDMREWFADDGTHGLQLLHRCEELGINACQMGGPNIEALLRDHYAEGGSLQWIATFYSQPGQGKEELERILKMRPRPIGVQQIGNTSDALMREGKIDRALENLKMFRDAGLLVGLGAHNHETIDHVAGKDWDLDFYQCCFYRSCFSLKPTRRGEIFEDEDRQAMVKTIRQLPKPVIAFKVLGAGRHCQTPASVEQAIRFAFEHVKPSDVVLLGMWQKYKDQVAENVTSARKALVPAV